MRADVCSDCGRSLDGSVDRYFSVPADADGERASSDAGAVYCRDCGFVRLNSDASLPAGALRVHAPTGPRR
ncbi:hypothetical protein [Halorussus marinus]|uniref:hypothetical protein n=1 Tax=Halorussus marinus TaxID=2505976 RepID=UPI00106E403B|nr:hypothetical protein [Halorussus marinus]